MAGSFACAPPASEWCAIGAALDATVEVIGHRPRWHGWRSRDDVHRGSTRPPTESFSLLYFDTIPHDPEVLTLLRAHASPDRIVCGGDRPFDVARPDPVGYLLGHGIDVVTLDEADGRSFLGLKPADSAR